MARTTINKTTPLGAYPTLPLGVTTADIVFTAADVANKNQCKLETNDILIAWNSGASPYTVTITSVIDGQNRTGDIATYSIAASTISVFGPFAQKGWRQTDGNIYFEASNASVKFAILRDVTN